MLKVTLVSIKNVLDVLSEYSQEVGRAGRDGSGSNACLYFNATAN
jgi:superfamily II DNA helicase RecQ